MPSDKKTYWEAAQQHLEKAQKQFDDKSYYLSHYLSGLAVECHFRAWYRLKTTDFVSSHSLAHWAAISDFRDLIPREMSEELSTALDILNKRWLSNHRFYPERQFYQYMRTVNAEKKEMGDRWKEIHRPHCIELRLQNHQNGRSQMEQEVKDTLEAAFSGIQVMLETLPDGRVAGSVVWEGFGDMDDVERQQEVRAELKKRLGSGAVMVGLLLTYTPSEIDAMNAA